jgi:hypothetical protein
MSARVAPPLVLLACAVTAAARAAPLPPDKADAEAVRALDAKLAAVWEANKINPSAPCDDLAFLRRAALDLVGRVATPAEIDAYLQDPKERRRALLVDRLLRSPEHDRYWAALWAGQLLPRAGVFRAGPYRAQLEAWLEDQLAAGRGYDVIVRGLLTAEGKTSDNGAVVFLLAQLPAPPRQGRHPPAEGPGLCTRDVPQEQLDDPAAPHCPSDAELPPGRRREEGRFEMTRATSRITAAFLGMDLRCIQCHDHPFTPDLRQEHFWGVNAFLRQVNRRGEPPADDRAAPALELFDEPAFNPDALVPYTRLNGVVRLTPAVFLGVGGERGPRLPRDTQGVARRRKLADFVIAHDGFARHGANRVWANLFGRGLAPLPGDLIVDGPPCGPALDVLAAHFKEAGYDHRRLLRVICASRAYQAGYVADKGNDKPQAVALFARTDCRPLSRAQAVGAILTATGAGVGAEQKELRERLERLLPVEADGTVALRVEGAVLMMNGPDLNRLLTLKGGTVEAAREKHGRDAKAIIRDLFLATLNREPTREVAVPDAQGRDVKVSETDALIRKMSLRPGLGDKDPAAPYQDLLWALLNSNEFLMRR